MLILKKKPIYIRFADGNTIYFRGPVLESVW